jgi:hypothetical protein
MKPKHEEHDKVAIVTPKRMWWGLIRYVDPREMLKGGVPYKLE